MNIPDTINAVNLVYHKELELDKLEQSIIELEDVLTNRRPDERNQANGEALLFRIKTKYLSLKYFDGGYYYDDYCALKSFLETVIPIAEKQAYVKTALLCKSVLTVANAVYGVMQNAEGEIGRIRDDEGNCTTNDLTILRNVKTEFTHKADALIPLEDTSKLFGEKVRMIDIKAQAIADLTEISAWADLQIARLNGEATEEFFKSSVKSLDEEEGDKFFEITPPLPDNVNTTAKAVVLCSPLKQEIILMARAYAKANSFNFVTINSIGFFGKSEEFIDKIFNTLAKNRQHCVIFGLSSYSNANKEYLFERIIKYTNEDLVALIVDSSGKRSLYDELYEISKSKEGLSNLDVTYKYVTLPLFREVTDALEKRGMISVGDHEYVRQNFAFCGYTGINKAINYHVQGKDWKEFAIGESERNERLCASYIRNIASQSLLLDLSWRDLALGEKNTRKTQQFDYDTLKAANPNNIKKIMQSDISYFAKCGLITRYCLLCGDDIAYWKTVDVKEKERRVCDATKLVAFMLDCEYAPEVNIIPDAEWEDENSGGLCCDGGKRIIYRESCCMNYQWLVKAVCHECFHALQNTIINSGWSKWHWNEIGITKFRDTEWRYNFAHYNGNTKSVTYKIEIVECDARIFENDCFEQSANSWNLIDWE